MSHPYSFHGSLIQYWKTIYTEYQRLTATLGQPPFEFMPSNPQTINEYVPKDGDEIIIYFWDKEHKHTLLVVEAALLPDEKSEEVQVMVFPQGNSFEEPVKSAMSIWKEIKTALKRTGRRSNPPQRKQSASSITNIYVGGNVTDSNIVVGDENTIAITKTVFKSIYRAIEESTRNATEKQDLIAEVDEIKNEVAKGDDANESFLSRRLRNLKKMAPDVAEVALSTLANPIAGLGMIVQKIAKKIKEETK